MATGADVGGTSAGFVASVPGREPRPLKVPSTPAEPERAVLEGLGPLAERVRG